MKKPASPTKELYRQLRHLSAEQLWGDEVPAFDRAAPAERAARVAVVRAVGVVFSEAGTPEQQAAARKWLLGLLDDPEEKIRRYAMAALPKVGGGAEAEAALLTRLDAPISAPEQRSLDAALEKVGGEATLAQAPALGRATLKARANVARIREPTTLALDRPLHLRGGVRIHLHCRAGLERFLEEEFHARAPRAFRFVHRARACVALESRAPFAFADLLRFRAFHTAAFVLGTVPRTAGRDPLPALADLIASPASQSIFDAFTAGPIRYRLEFADAGHRRSAVRTLGELVFARCPRLLNDSRDAPWQIDLHDTPAGHRVELRPRLRPDPRFAYRADDVPAASHPPLAAALARLAGPAPADAPEIVWDPFCGSGLELVERALLGNVHRLIGSDLDPRAIAITRTNLAAALPAPPPADFFEADFRDVPRLAGWKPGALTLVVTNPPMGRRVPIPDLPELLTDLFAVAARMLRPGGRLVLANPLPVTPGPLPLRRTVRQKVDLGGFHCHVEHYVRTPDRA